MVHRKLKDNFSSEFQINHELTPFQSFSGETPLSFGNVSFTNVNNETIEVEINEWRGKTIYYTPHPLSYVELLNNYAVPKGEQCKEGYKQCGILDTMNNTICLENYRECPINDIRINKTVPESFKDYSDYSLIPLDEKYNLYYTNKAINKPIITELLVSPYINKKLIRWIDTTSIYVNEIGYDKNISLYYRSGYYGYDIQCIKSNKTLENSNFFNNGKTVRILMIITLSFSLLFWALPLIKVALDKYITISYILDSLYAMILFTLTLVSYILMIKIDNTIEICINNDEIDVIKSVLKRKETNRKILLALLIIVSIALVFTIIELVAHLREEYLIHKFFGQQTFHGFGNVDKNIGTITQIKKIKCKDSILEVILLNNDYILVLLPYFILIYNNKYELFKEIKEEDKMISICQIKNGLLVTSHENKTLKIRTITGENVKIFPIENNVGSLTSLENNNFACVVQREASRLWLFRTIFWTERKVLQIWTVRREPVLPILMTNITLENLSISHLKYNKNKKIIIVSSIEVAEPIRGRNNFSKFYLIDVNSLKCIYNFKQTGEMITFSYLDKEHVIYRDSYFHSIIIWDIKGDKIEDEINYNQKVHCFLEMTSNIVLLGEDGGIRIFDYINKKQYFIKEKYNVFGMIKIDDNCFVCYSKQEINIMQFDRLKDAIDINSIQIKIERKK